MFFKMNPFFLVDFWGSAVTAYFTKGEPAKKKEPEPPMKVVWEIGPGGYPRGHCVPV